jgi:ornithine cyclodeaminase/alanine dehydrogenase-like protein (mu-crystallin family)
MKVFSDSAIRLLLKPLEVVAALDAAFARDYHGTVVMPLRTHVDISGRGLLLLMPCYDSAVPAFGIKLWTDFGSPAAEQRSQATYVFLDPETGDLCAIMAANYLTDLRTAATSAVATNHMARKEAKVLGVFGTGRQARAHLEVLRAVRYFDRILVCGSSPDRSREFARALANEGGFQIEPADAQTCASQSDVICTCTTSTTPVVKGRWLRPGTHLNLVGAFQPQTREVDSETVRRARVAVEGYDNALAEAGDILIPLSEGVIGREHVAADLHELASGKKPGRTSAEEITVFKNLGCALEDLVTANLVWQKGGR